MNITVVGSGVVGRTVAPGFGSHGHHVTLSSRTPGELSDWSAETGPLMIRLGTAEFNLRLVRN